MHVDHARYLALPIVLLLLVQDTPGQTPQRPSKPIVLQTRSFPIPFPGYSYAYCNRIAFSKDGTLLATGAGSRLVVWDVETRKVITQMQLTEKQYAINVAFTTDGKTLVYNGLNDPMVRFFDVKTGKQTHERPHSNAPKKVLRAPPGKKREEGYQSPFLAFSPDARQMAILDRNRTVKLVDTRTGKVLLHLDKADSGWWGNWAFSPDGKMFATSPSNALVLYIWDTKTGELIRTLGDPNERTRSGYVQLRFSHDSKFLFGRADKGTVWKDRHVSIWGVQDGLEYCRLPGTYYIMDMSPDRRMVLSAAGGHFRAYDLRHDKTIDNITIPTKYLYGVQRSPDGLTLALLGGTGNGKDNYTVYLAPFPMLPDTTPVGPLTTTVLDELWTDLCSANLFNRRYATKVFKAYAKQTVTYVADKVKPVPAAERQRILDQIKMLDDDDYKRRDAAMKTLRAKALHFEPLLREMFKTSPKGEVRNRIASILNGLRDQQQPADLLRELRGIELLQALSTPAARKLLDRLAGGASGARTSTAAGLALKKIDTD